jgi:hypothetical protein
MLDNFFKLLIDVKQVFLQILMCTTDNSDIVNVGHYLYKTGFSSDIGRACFRALHYMG